MQPDDDESLSRRWLHDRQIKKSQSWEFRTYLALSTGFVTWSQWHRLMCLKKVTENTETATPPSFRHDQLAAPETCLHSCQLFQFA